MSDVAEEAVRSPGAGCREEPLLAVSIPEGILKSGASLLTTDVRTASAKLLSGRSHEPRQAATA